MWKNLGYALFGAEKAPAGMCAVKMDFYLQKTPILGVENLGYAVFGAEKAPAGMGTTTPYF